jgi:hypothetical protein
MKQNKKLNLSEAANQVMGVLDATGRSDADASGRGSALPYPVDVHINQVSNEAMTGIGLGSPTRTSAGTHATAAYKDVVGLGKPDVAKHTNTQEGNEDADETEDYDDSDEEETKKKKELQMEDFRNALISLLGEENINEDALGQLEAIFEVAVADRVETQVAKILVDLDEGAKGYLENVTNSLVEKVDDYLEYVVEEWMTENAVAVEQGVKTTIAENFISGLKNLFENHYIDVPNEKYNVLDDLYAQNRELENRLNESIKFSIDLKKEVALTECAGIFVSETRNMADTQVSKLQNLMENINFNTPDEYRNKLVAIRENYLQGGRVSAPSKPVDEDMSFSQAVSVPTTLVEGYANVLGRLNKKL